MKVKPQEGGSSTSSAELPLASRIGVSGVTKKLKGCRSIRDLKARLDLLSKSSSNDEPSIRVEDVAGPSNMSPAKAVFLSPTRHSPLSKNLRHDVPAPVSPSSLYNDAELKADVDPFPLPGHMIELENRFRDFDNAIAFAFNRLRGPMSFNHVRGVLKTMSGWNVSHGRMGQFKAVFPGAWQFDARGESEDGFYLMPLIGSSEFTPSLLVDRVGVFHENLVEIGKAHHDEFLLSLKPPISVCPTKVRRWHPLFRYDRIPTVKPDVAYPFLSQASETETSTPTPTKASVCRSLFRDETTESDAQGETSPAPERSSVRRELFNDDFLSRVRQKEAERSLRYITRSEEDAKKLRMLKRLVEIVRMLPSVFVSEKMNALSLKIVCDKLIASYPGLFTRETLTEHIELLSEEVKAVEKNGRPLLSLSSLRTTASAKILRLERSVHYSVFQEVLQSKVSELERR